MKEIEFKDSLSLDTPPPNLTIALEALWYDGKGNWEKAHELVNDLKDQPSCWVHAYLHRKEGDNWNADYWYRNANKKRPNISLEEEWQLIVSAML